MPKAVCIFDTNMALYLAKLAERCVLGTEDHPRTDSLSGERITPIEIRHK